MFPEQLRRLLDEHGLTPDNALRCRDLCHQAMCCTAVIPHSVQR